MIRIVHDLAALASMAGFVSMVCVVLRFFG